MMSKAMTKQKLVSLMLALMLVLGLVPAQSLYADEAAGVGPQTGASTDSSASGKPGIELPGANPEATNDDEGLAPQVQGEQNPDDSTEPVSLDAPPPAAEPSEQAPTQEAEALEQGEEVSVYNNKLSGTVFHDANEDGVHNVDESGIEGIAVELLDAGDAIAAQMLTDGNGTYSFEDIEPGSYRLSIKPQTLGQTEYLLPLPSAGTDRDNKFTTASESVEPIAYTEAVEIADDSTVENVGAGLRTVSIAPLAVGDPLVVDTTTTQLTTTNLQTVIEDSHTPEEIAAATVLEIRGSQDPLGLGGQYSPTASIDYLNSLGVTTLDLSGFNGRLTDYAFAYARGIQLVATGGITTLPLRSFLQCTSLTGLGQTLAQVQAEPNVIDLQQTAITLLSGSGQFFGCSSITTVTMASAINSLPQDVFRECESLHTLSNTLGNARLYPRVIDLAKTGATLYYASGGYQFASCSAIETVTLGPAIKNLPRNVFEGCSSLATLSNTADNARNNLGIIDLDKTAVNMFSSQGGQFAQCSSIVSVAFGSKMDTLASSAFYRCIGLTTLSDTADNVRNNPNVIDLDITAITTLALGGAQFDGCSSLKTVALGSAIQSMPSLFLRATGLTTLSDTIDNARFKPGVVDLDKTEIRTFTGVSQFYGCNDMTTIALGSKIESLPVFVLGYCENLVTLSDTVENAEQNQGIIGLDKTAIRTLESGGNQFCNSTKLTTVALGSKIDTLPTLVFSFCKSLVTLSDTAENTRNTPGIIDLASTAVAAYDQGGQFRSCTSLTTVVLGTAAVEIPYNCFSYCSALRTVTDTVENAEGISEGLLDFGKLHLMTFPTKFGEFYGDTSTRVYIPIDGVVQYTDTFGYMEIFLSPTVQVYDDGSNSRNTFYLHGPANQLPSSILLTNVQASSKTYYYDVKATTDGNGTIVADKSVDGGGFISDLYENRERAQGTLLAEHNYAFENKNLTYTITPDTDYVVKDISVNGTVVNPISVTDNTYVLSGVAQDSEIIVTFETFKTVTEHYVDRAGNPIPSLPDTSQTVSAGSAYTYAGSVPGVTEKVYVGFQTTAPTSSTPSIVADEAIPSIASVDDDADVYLVYGNDFDEDDKEDVKVTRHFVGDDGTAAGTALTGNLTPATKVVNLVDSPYTEAETGVQETGWTYVGWNVNGDLANRTAGAPSVDLVADSNPDVYYVYERIPVTHSIAVSFADTDGNAIEGGARNYTHDAADGSSFSAGIPSISGYTYDHWELDGVAQGSGVATINPVLSSHDVVLVYKAGGGTVPPGPDNYEFVKAPNKKTVRPGEEVYYTFDGFANKWGVPLQRYTITDKPDAGLAITGAHLPAFNNASGVIYDVYYYTASNQKVLVAQGLSAEQAQSLSIPRAANGEHIRALTFDFGDVPVGFGEGNTFSLSFRVWDDPPSRVMYNVGLLTYKVGDEWKAYVIDGPRTSVTLGGFFGLPQTGDGILAQVASFAVLLSLSGAYLFSVRRRRKNRGR